jgi:chromosome partitioning protein
MYTLAIVNQKGGVGKTTTAVTLAHGLARHPTIIERPVLLVDLDAQGNVADALGVEKSGGLYELLVGGGQAVTRNVREGLDVVLSDKTAAAAKQILAGRPFREHALADALERLADEYALAILDVAPGVDVLQVAAMVACDAFLIPVALDHLAVVGAADALGSVAALARHGLAGRFLGVLPTMWERSTNESHAQLTALAERFAEYVWPPIPLDVKAREAPAYGKTLWEYAQGTRALVGVEIDGECVGGYWAAVGRVLEIVLGGDNE